MTNLKRFIFILVITMFFLSSVVFASSSINMNLAQEANTTGNNTVATQTNQTSQTSQANSMSTNTGTVITSVNELDNSTAGLQVSDVLNIILIAVGVVVILLAIAILIRLKG